MPRGQPQIEVTFDIDVNGILNVSAKENSTGKSQKITITNEKGRLSKEEIERLVQEAERNKEADESASKKIEAKNQLEQYCYSARSTLSEEKLKTVFTEDEKKTVEAKIDEVLKWVNDNPAASKEEFEAKTKEVEAVFNPIMQRVYQATGGQGMPGQGGQGGFPGGFPGGQGGFPGGFPGGQHGDGNNTSKTNPDDVD